MKKVWSLDGTATAGPQPGLEARTERSTPTPAMPWVVGEATSGGGQEGRDPRGSLQL